MKKISRAVLDTNVFVSAFVFKKEVYVLAEAWLQGKFVWVLSPAIEKEYLDVIRRPKFQQTQEEIEEIGNLLEEAKKSILMEYVEPEKRLHIISEDPKDNMFLECAVAGKADYIVSGDRHLLELKQYRGILIFSPRVFLAKLEV